VYVIMYCAVCA